jgi:hypothetical protein
MIPLRRSTFARLRLSFERSPETTNAERRAAGMGTTNGSAKL